jgi:histidinol dehydrogenase
MRPCLALALLLSGCVTVVISPRDADPDFIARVTLGRAQREAEAQQVMLRRESLEAITATAARIASDVQAWALKSRSAAVMEA